VGARRNPRGGYVHFAWYGRCPRLNACGAWHRSTRRMLADRCRLLLAARPTGCNTSSSQTASHLQTNLLLKHHLQLVQVTPHFRENSHRLLPVFLTRSANSCTLYLLSHRPLQRMQMRHMRCTRSFGFSILSSPQGGTGRIVEKC
jgi:hypothetical protein